MGDNRYSLTLTTTTFHLLYNRGVVFSTDSIIEVLRNSSKRNFFPKSVLNMTVFV